MPKPPLNVVCTSQHLRVIKTKWPKEGQTWLKIQNPHSLDIHSPICFQKQTRTILDIKDPGIIVDKPVELYRDDMTLTQKSAHADPEKIHEELMRAWNEYFQRDAPDEEDAIIDDGDLLQHIPTFPETDFPSIRGIDLKKVFVKSKKTSARGADAFATRDLCKLPDALFDVLAVMLESVEHLGLWPKNLDACKNSLPPKG